MASRRRAARARVRPSASPSTPARRDARRGEAHPDAGTSRLAENDLGGGMGDAGSSIDAGAGAGACGPRPNPMGWLGASVCAGAAAALFALDAAWRPFPWLPAPPGPLADHLAAWAREGLALPFPGLFHQSRSDYARAVAALPGAELFALRWREALGALAGLAPAPLLWRPFMRPSKEPTHLRGSRRWEGRRAKAKLVARLAAASKAFPDHEIAPGIPFPSTEWTRQVLVVGGTGSGKSTFLKPLIDKIVRAREQILLFDPKGEFTAQWPQLWILAPWDARSLAWDIARDVRGIGDARKFAEALVVGGGNDPMWSNAARQIVVGLLLRLKGGRGDDWGWAELASLLAAPLPELCAIIAESHPEALRAVEKASVTTQGILINLASFCAPVFDLARAWGAHPPERRISFVEWAKGGSKRRGIVLQGHESYSELSRCYVRGVFEAVSSIVASAEGEEDPRRKLWIVADEFPQLSKVPIRSILSMGRSRNCRCVLAFQDFAQVEEVHGDKFARAMGSMCGTIVVAQIQQGETADAVAKMLGTRLVEREVRSTTFQSGSKGSTTVSHAREESPIYKPSELGSRLGATADRKGVVCALIHGGEAYELTWPMHPRRRARPQQAMARWTSGSAPFAPMPAADILDMAPEAPPGGRDADPAATDAALAEGVAADEGGDALDEIELAPSPAAGGAASFSEPAIDPLLIEQLMRGLGDAREDEGDAEPQPRPAPPVGPGNLDGEEGSHAGTCK